MANRYRLGFPHIIYRTSDKNIDALILIQTFRAGSINAYTSVWAYQSKDALSMHTLLLIYYVSIPVVNAFP